MGTQAKFAPAIRELLATEAFTEWFRRYQRLHVDLQHARESELDVRLQAEVVAIKVEDSIRRSDALLYAAGDLEEAAGQALARSASTENASFEALSQFETERRHATEAWQNNDRLEKLLDDQRQHGETLRARSAAARRQGGNEASAEADRLEGQVRELEATLAQTEKENAHVRDRMLATARSRDTLWVQVEKAWSTGFAASMARSEFGYQARKGRAEAEELLRRSRSERDRLETLRQQQKLMKEHLRELAEQSQALLQEARTLFGCAVTAAFLCWPQQENTEAAWVVPLVDEPRHFNIEVAALQLYQVDRGRGLDFIEPVADEVESSEDVRLTHFFSGAAHAAAQPRQGAH